MEKRGGVRENPQNPALNFLPSRGIILDEDYDDSGEEDKKAGIVSGPASGPGSATSEMKAPTSAGINGINGHMGQKVEG